MFAPVPALADPGAAQPPTAPIAVPNPGVRPVALGTLQLPGQSGTQQVAVHTIPGAASSPVLQQVEKGREDNAAMGDQLIGIKDDRTLAKQQQTAAQQQYDKAVEQMQQARADVAAAAAQSMIQAAAMPPGVYDPQLADLDNFARLQRGESDTSQVAAVQLANAETAVQLALDANTLAQQKVDELTKKYDALNAQLHKKEVAQSAFEAKHKAEIDAAEASETATDNALGQQYLAGAEAGRGADPRALQALTFALAQRGDPYVWSEEGPNAYDCSGLTYAAYHSVGFPLERVSRDQYWQTHLKVVDRYSLLPGDLLFFSYSNSWRGIHHVAMYAGDGMMVEAPRTGLNVRLTPVRWTQLFQATRVFGSVPGVTEGPALGSPDPDPSTPDNNPTTSPTPSPSATTKPPTSSPTSKPTTTPPTTKPTTTPPTTKPTTTPPTTTPTTPATTAPTTPATTEPTTTAPANNPTTAATTAEPTSASTTAAEPSSASTSSATAAEHTSQSASASAG
ncbi:C40 family peptidase [Actinoplanes subtropicus]|uniref:C40 family peptidase n=1 Tax=Actinoplanes subtropicus TaxID=543632 RepID=UPI000A5BC1E0|nr:C40 family peptidase [Actinoplanes subtropicus]